MTSRRPPDGLDVEQLALALEELTRIAIRMPSIQKLSFTTLSVLHTLAGGGPRRLGELTDSEQVTQSAVTQIVTRLERDGLVERRPDPADGRAVLVSVTPAGAAVIESRRAQRVDGFARLAEALTDSDRDALAAAVPALVRLAGQGRSPTAGDEQR